MKCPYNQTELYIEKAGDPNCHSIDIEQRDGTPDRIHVTNAGRSWVSTYQFADCLRDGCAAWQNGRCVRTA